MFHEISPHVFHNEYAPAPPRPGDKVLACRGAKALVRLADGRLSLADWAGWPERDAPLRYLFAVDGTRFYLAPWPQAEPAGFAAVPCALLRAAQPMHLAFAAVSACLLAAGYAAIGDSLAHAFLVEISLCSINAAIPCRDSVQHAAFGVLQRNLEYSVTQHGDFDTIS